MHRHITVTTHCISKKSEMHEKKGRVYLLCAVIGFIGSMRSRLDAVQYIIEFHAILML